MGLKNGSGVRILQLSHNKELGDEGIAAISAGLKAGGKQVKLESLNLSNCGVTDAGVQALGIALLGNAKNCDCLRDINLSGNEITDEGVKMLTEGILSLQKNGCQGKIKLDLSCNPIGDKGVSLAASIFGRGAVRKLYLDDLKKPFGESCMQSLCLR